MIDRKQCVLRGGRIDAQHGGGFQVPQTIARLPRNLTHSYTHVLQRKLICSLSMGAGGCGSSKRQKEALFPTQQGQTSKDFVMKCLPVP